MHSVWETFVPDAFRSLAIVSGRHFIAILMVTAAVCLSGPRRVVAAEPPAPQTPPAPPTPPSPAAAEDDPIGEILPPKPLDPPAPNQPPDLDLAPGVKAADRPEGMHDALWQKIGKGETPPAVYLGSRGQAARFQVAQQDAMGRWQVREFYAQVNQPVGEPVYLLRDNRKIFVNFATGYIFTAFETPIMQGKKVVRPDGVTVAARGGPGDKKFLPNLGPSDPVIDDAVQRHRQMVEAQMEAVREKCRHPDSDLRTAALLLLCKYLPDAEPHFAKLLADDDVTIRSHTLLVLCASGQDYGWARLRDALKDRDPKMRAMALYLVTEFERADLAEVLGALCGDEDERLRTLAVYALVPQPGENKLFVLRKCLVDPAPGVVVAAIRALAYAGDPQSAEPIGKKIFDGHPDIRRAALEAVTGWPTADNVERVLAALGDRQAEIRNLAAVSLRRMTGIDATLDAGLDTTGDPAEASYVRKLQLLNQRWLKEKATLKLSSPNGRIGHCVRLQPTPGKVESMAFSADGRYLALGGTFIVTVLDLQEETERTFELGTIATQLHFAPDAQALYFRVRGPASQDLHRVTLGAVTEHSRYSDPQVAAKPTQVGWRDSLLSADGKILYGLHADGRRVVAFDTASGKGEALPYSMAATSFDRLGLITVENVRGHPGDVLVCGGRENGAWLLQGRRFTRWAEPCVGVIGGQPAAWSPTVTDRFIVQLPPLQRNRPAVAVDLTGTRAWRAAGPVLLQLAPTPNALRPSAELVASLGLNKLMNARLDDDHLELRLRSATGGEVIGEYPQTASVETMAATADGRWIAFCSGGKLSVYKR